ncbi:MAG: PqqD family protein, partial [Bacteroidales bacterium]|nr:PqqD family protein [Bacteroidales bacterium]
LKSVPHQSSSIVTRKTGNEYVLVPLSDNIADMDSIYTLNETGAFLWELIDGKKCINDLVEALVAEYNVERDNAEKDVFEFINNMKKYLIIN